MYYGITSLWAIAIALSLYSGRRVLPIAVGLLGGLVHAGIWVWHLGYWGIAGLGVLTAICMLSAPEFFGKEL